HLRLDQFQLRDNIVTARGHLLFAGFSVFRRSALDDVAHVDRLASEAHCGYHLVEQLPGRTNEGVTLSIFVGAWSLADENYARRAIAAGEYRVRATFAQAAVSTLPNLVLEHGETCPALFGIECRHWCEA